MKKQILLCASLLVAHGAMAADSAGLIGIMNVSGTVTVNNQVVPKDIWNVYIANDPAEQNTLLAYLAFREVGAHQASIEWKDDAGNALDRCEFEPVKVHKTPWIHTFTCKWGGRLPTGGIHFSVFDTFGGKKQKIGQMFIPAKP